MSNEELKKKICEIIADNYLPKEMPDRLEDYKLYRFERAADALIAAGIGDVKTAQEIGASATAMAVLEAAKEAEHRAEVAERALKDRATYCATYCVMEGMDCFSLTSVAIEARAKELYKSWRRKSEKELAEEGEDGTKTD